jgi:hypothetical protein
VANQLTPKVVLPTTEQEIKALVKRASKGDESTLPVLRELFKDPGAVDRCGGNLARQTELSLIQTAAGDNLTLREALTRKMELLRQELAGPNPTALERLLVERVATCWLQLQDADVRFAQARDLSREWGDYYQRRIDRAHQRYLTAIKTLATVRKLALPVLQVNIAKKQVNMAGNCVNASKEKVSAG